MKLQHELNIVSIATLLILAASIIFVGAVMMNQIVHTLYVQLLESELEKVMQQVQTAYENVEHPATEMDLSNTETVQHALLDSLDRVTFGGSGNLYIVNRASRAVLHKYISSGDMISFYFIADMLEKKQGFVEYTYRGRARYCVFDTFDPWGWTIALSVKKEEVYLNRLTFLRIVVIVTFAILIMSITMFQAYSQRITQNIEITLDCLQKVEEGDLTARIIPDIETEEIVNLQSGINSMIKTIKLRTDELLHATEEKIAIEKKLLQEEIQHKEAEINFLQSQINPHFLYNTLECMNSIGALHEVPEIQEIAMSLSSLFRYSISGRKFVTLEEELKSVEDYLNIQRIRFLDRFTISIKYDKDILKTKIIKFILQPIIENSIFHGLEPKIGKGELNVLCTQNGSFLDISVKDNGTGIDQETLKNLSSSLAETMPGQVLSAGEKRSIGLYNIQNRIKLVYGNDYGLKIESEINRGTVIRMRLPLITG